MNKLSKAETTKLHFMKAAKKVLLSNGYSGLTTRAVSREAEAPMSQIQYHFGSKEGMILALYQYMDQELLTRQNNLFTDETKSLSQEWDLACDYLDDDLANGYVRVLHELTAVGWANKKIAQAMRESFMQWMNILIQVAKKAEEKFGSLGFFSAEEIAILVSSAFIGAESHILLGMEDCGLQIRQTLRKFGRVIENLEMK